MALAIFSLSSKAQNGLDFDGTDDRVDCGNDTSVQITGKKITLEAWIYPTAWKTNVYEGNVINKEYNTSNYGYMLRVGGSGQLNFAIGDGTWRELTTGSILKLNAWQHIAATYDGTKMRVYLNGVAVDSSTVTASISVTSSTNLLLGGHLTYTRYYQGMMDEVRIWNTTRSANELYDGMYSEICDHTDGLRAYYKFNHGKPGQYNLSVKSLADLSGWGNVGTLKGFTLNGGASNWLRSQTFNRTVANTNDTLAICEIFRSPSGKYTWNKSGVYNDTLSTWMGCDSVITIYLTIKKNTFRNMSVYACKSYTGPSGLYTWTATGTYKDYLKNYLKCDSIITIFLKIGGSRDTVKITVCNSYKSPAGKVYTNSGFYTDSLLNYRGCDSVIVTNLSVNSSTYATHSYRICRTFISPSNKYVYKQTGVYGDTIKNAKGCDSVLTINITNISSSSTVQKIGCGKYISPSGKYTWTQSGTYKDTITNYFGCDSVVNIQLSIRNSSTGSITVTACRSYLSPSKRRVWKSTAVYKDTITNVAGCDSVITVNLTINNVDASASQSGKVLTATNTTGTYQWLNCSQAMAIVPNETQQSFTAKANGSYAVEVTENSCKDTSACFTVSGVNIKSIFNSGVFTIAPNPTSGNFTVTLPEANDQITIRVIDVSGKVVFEQSYNSMKAVQLQLDQSPGMYLLVVKGTNFNGVQYLIVQ